MASGAWVVLTLAWGAAGAVVLRRSGDVPLGLLMLWFALIAGTVTLARAQENDVAAVAAALLPAALLHVLLALPSGRLERRGLQLTVGAGYLLAAVIGVLIWTDRPSSPAWPVAIEVVVASVVGVNAAVSRYLLTRGRERRRMGWVVLAAVGAAELVLVVGTVYVLVGWPPHVLRVAALAAVPLPLALLLETWRRVQGSADRLLLKAIPLVGLTAVVVSVYLLVVLGLGRPPTDEQGTLLVLSVAAAGISALLYVQARRRVTDFANRLVHGNRRSPEDVLRSFGTGLSRAVPLEELLRRVAESLQSTLVLASAEIWTGSGGTLERIVSVPDCGPASLHLSSTEQAVATRWIGGSAWTTVWLPQLLAGRDGADVRVAPIMSSGELFGLIVVERPSDAEPFEDESEDVLEELARGLGLGLRNVRLDSELQASLEELRQQAAELQASRARVVAAGDAERRRIERDLHDGAQQYLVGLAVQLRLTRELADTDPAKVKPLLDELVDVVKDVQQGLRDLAHGIYPPLLQDRGLTDALAAAALLTTIPTRLEATGAGRYSPDVEGTVYFCCLEALQNAAKHAGDDAHAGIRIWEEAANLLFEVRDDGAGFDPERSGGGAGLTNMRDRLGAIGGSLDVASQTSRGTRVTGKIPLVH